MPKMKISTRWKRVQGCEYQAVPAAEYPEGSLWVDNSPMHLCAFEVEQDADENWKVRDPQFEEDYNAVCILEGEANPRAVELEGVDGWWIVYAIPFGR